jgi:negative regulator of genetic competence, sporulation and motility
VLTCLTGFLLKKKKKVIIILYAFQKKHGTRQIKDTTKKNSYIGIILLFYFFKLKVKFSKTTRMKIRKKKLYHIAVL